MTGGRGPDVSDRGGGDGSTQRPRRLHLYDKVKTSLKLQTDRPTAVREAIHGPRAKAAAFSFSVSLADLIDKFPLGAVMNKGLTLRSAQQHGHRYIPMLLERIQPLAKSRRGTSPPRCHAVGRCAPGVRRSKVKKMVACAPSSIPGASGGRRLAFGLALPPGVGQLQEV